MPIKCFKTKSLHYNRMLASQRIHACSSMFDQISLNRTCCKLLLFCIVSASQCSRYIVFFFVVIVFLRSYSFLIVDIKKKKTQPQYTVHNTIPNTNSKKENRQLLINVCDIFMNENRFLLSTSPTIPYTEQKLFNTARGRPAINERVYGSWDFF